MQTLLNSLSGNYSGCISNFAEVSKGGKANLPMIDEQLTVINYDDIAKKHCAEKEYGDFYKSNDALFVDANGKLHFIEFKSGTFKPKELRGKSTNSIILALDIGLAPSLRFFQEKVEYILVYDLNSLGKLNSNARGLVETAIRCQKWLYKRAIPYTPALFKKKFLALHIPGYTP